MRMLARPHHGCARFSAVQPAALRKAAVAAHVQCAATHTVIADDATFAQVKFRKFFAEAPEQHGPVFRSFEDAYRHYSKVSSLAIFPFTSGAMVLVTAPPCSRDVLTSAFTAGSSRELHSAQHHHQRWLLQAGNARVVLSSSAPRLVRLGTAVP